jgi:type IV pilus assembly protein PilA
MQNLFQRRETSLKSNDRTVGLCARAPLGRSYCRESGFTLVEVSVVVVLMVLMLTFSFPFIKELFTETKVKPAVEEMSRIIKVITSAHIGANASYATADTGEIATIALGSSAVFTPNAAKTVLNHSLSSVTATVTMAPATVSAANDAATITVNLAARATCPGFVAGLQHAAVAMTINGTSVKAVGGSFLAPDAQVACTDGDTNTYVLTIK